MTRVEFLSKLSEILMAEQDRLAPDTELRELSGWDSMGQVSVFSLLDEAIGTTPAPGVLQKCTTVGDILALAEPRLAA
jgi:acyl carrier protein